MIPVLYDRGNVLAADPYVVGTVGKANLQTKQTGDPKMIVQAQSPEPPVFPVQTWYGGLKQAIFRTLPTSVRGQPSGPPRRNLGVTRGTRVRQQAPQTVERAVQRGGQVRPTRPLWESYLSEYTMQPAS